MSEVIAKTNDLQIRIMSLEPREIASWHYHTEVTDQIFCLTGSIIVRMKNPDVETRLAPGERCSIEIRRPHQLENLEDAESNYLLVQGLGKYDFNVM